MEKETLVQQIKQWNEEYWKGGQTVSDAEYDKAMKRLREIDPDNNLRDFLGTPYVPDGKKVKHDVPMLSLDKAYTHEDLRKWIRTVSRGPEEVFLCQPKYDGVSADWDTAVLSTRGDGQVGEDITDKCSLISVLTYDTAWEGEALSNFSFPARGELLMLDGDFEAANRNGAGYKNPRNAVSGVVGSKYSVEWAMHMRRMGVRIVLVPHDEYSIEVTEKELFDNFDDIKDRLFNKLPVQCDGIVIKLADRWYADSLGYTSHHPKGAIAYKMANTRVTTTLKDIEWSVGINAITPVAILEPVDIDGVTVQRASLHNMQNIIDRDIWIGDEVTVERAGSVIPYISGNTHVGTKNVPTCDVCPSCHGKTSMKGPELVCTNPDCKARKVKSLVVSAATLDIYGMAEKTVEKLVECGVVTSVADFFRLTEQDLMTLDGFSEKSAENMRKAIEKATHTKDYILLAAMNIPEVGKTTAKAILSRISLHDIYSATVEQLKDIEGVGDVTAQNIVDWFSVDTNADDFRTCMGYCNCTDTSMEVYNPGIVFTGAMEHPRSWYHNLALSYGYTPQGSVTKTTEILVVPEEGHTSSKVTRATKLGVKIMTVKQFMELINA